MATRLRASVMLDRETPAGELADVRAAFAAAGIDGPCDAVVERYSADLLPWVIYVTVSYPIGRFFGGFFEAAGEDGYRTFKAWVHDVRAARGGHRGSVVVQSKDGTRVVLSSEIPDEALGALRKVDWSQRACGDFIWDDDAGEWRDALNRR